jgi:hypothetical protein
LRRQRKYFLCSVLGAESIPPVTIRWSEL